MYYNLTSLRWWFTGTDPIKVLGFWQAMVWYVLLGCFLAYFVPWEFLGVFRHQKSGAVPLTWFIECQPPFLIVIELATFVWHFVLHNWPFGRH